MRFSPCHLICEGRAFAFFKNHVDNFGYVRYNRLFSLKFTDSLNFLELNSLQSNWPAGQFIFFSDHGKEFVPINSLGVVPRLSENHKKFSMKG